MAIEKFGYRVSVDPCDCLVVEVPLRKRFATAPDPMHTYWMQFRG